MKLAILTALLVGSAECMAKDIVERKLTPASQLVLQHDETDAKTTYRLQLRKSGQPPVEFYFKEVAKEAGKHSEWLSLLDALESDGKVTALVATGIGSFILLQGAENGRLESQQWVHSQALAMTLNSGDGIVRLVSPREIVFRPPSFTESVTAMVMPDGELHVDGKPFLPYGGVLKVGSGAFPSRSSAATPDGAATDTGAGTGGQTPASATAPVPAPKALTGKEISRKINGGTIKEIQTPKDAEHYVATLFWQPDGGVPVVIDRAERSRVTDPHWTLRAGYFDGNRIALWRTKASGMTEYWGFTEKEGNWKLTDRAYLGTTTSIGYDKAQFTSVRTLELLNGNEVSIRFEVTEQPRGGDPFYRKVLRNGVEWAPEGTLVGTEGEALLAAIRAKSGAAAATPAPAPASATAPAPEARAGEEISRRINGGVIKEILTPKDAEHYVATLYWQPDGGEPVVIDRAERSRIVDPHWTLSAGYFDGNKIALWRIQSSNLTEYWGFTEKEGKWKLTDRAYLGTTTSIGYDKAQFTSVRTLELLNNNKVLIRFEVTEQPRSGDAVYRKVLRNGVEWAMEGTVVGTEAEELMAAIRAKSGAAAVAPAPAPEARARKEMSRRINGGIIKEVQTHKDAEHYVATLYWMPDGGVPVVIDRAERSRKIDPHWTVRAGYFEGNRISLWRWNAMGRTDYWGFTEKEGTWQLTDRAPLDSCSLLAFDHVRFASVRRLELMTGNKVSVRYEITEESRGGDPVYRKVLRNGVEWAAPGVFIRGDTEESLAAVAAKSSRHGERLLIIKGGMIVETREPRGGGRYVTTLYWQVDGGGRVVVDQSEQSANEDMRWTLDAGYFDGENIALWRGDASGMTEYWCYTQQKDSKWKLTKRAQLGSFAGTGIDDARFNSLRALELLKGDVVKVRFAVTDTPRGGDPVYRKVLRNGVEWAPKGSAFGTELQDLAEVQKRKPGTAAGAIVKPVDSAAGSVAGESPPVASSDQPNNRSRLPWVAGGAVALLGVGWLLWRGVGR